VRAIGYVRVSTEEQATSGLGLDAQRASIAAAAKRLSLELAHVHADEGVSGATPPAKRPALARALEQLGAGDVLLVAKRDRLGRNVVHVAVLELDLSARGVRIISAAGEGTEDDEPTSRLMRRIIDAFAEYERDVTRDRTRKALRASRDRGRRAGALPFGFRLVSDHGKEIEPDPVEQETLSMIRELRAGGRGYGAIARELVRRERPARGAKWHPQSVKTILGTDQRAYGPR
jgi:DNA invertase Pin-like site-specific DNA recombinase